MNTARSHGQQAAQLVTDHLMRAEEERDELRQRISQLEHERAELFGRMTEQGLALNRAEANGAAWMLKASQLAQTVINVSSVMVNGASDAKAILDSVAAHDATRTDDSRNEE